MIRKRGTVHFDVAGNDTYAYTGTRTLDTANDTILFVHGAGLEHSVWVLQSRYFAHHGYNVLAVDLPGHGRSQGTPLSRIESMADWTVAVLDALDVSAAAFVGHSMGSLVTLEAAARHPDRVRFIGLIGSCVPMPVSDALLAAAKANDHAAFDMVNVWGHGYPAQLGGNQSPGMWMTGLGMRLLERSGRGVLYTDLNACNEYTVGLESAARVRCPTHVIAGKLDMMSPPRAARALIRALPQVKVTELEGAGHMLMSERPGEVLDALISSFNELEQQRRLQNTEDGAPSTGGRDGI